jgi:hypothetical protein
MKLRSYVLGIVALIFGLGGLVTNAQERPTWGPAVSFTNGTFIQTGIGTVPPGDSDLKVVNTEVMTAASSSPKRGVFRRILRLFDGRAIIYEIAVAQLDDNRSFEVSLGSWTPTADEAREMGINPARLETNFLGKYPGPITVNDGDLLALDVLLNPRTGVKLVDYFRITGSRPVVRNNAPNPAATARPIEINDVEFAVENFELRLNGKEVYASKGGMSGRFIWLDVPQTGRFIFSLTPLAEADGFHRTAYLTRQQIVFNNGDDKYELTSEHPIVPASGVFSLWVRLDPTFTFPGRLFGQVGNHFSIGAADSLPLQQKRE